MVASNCPSEDLENPDTGQRKVDGATAHIANFYVGRSRKAQMPCEKRTCPSEIAEVLDLADSTAERASTLGLHCSGESLRSCSHYLKLRTLPNHHPREHERPLAGLLPLWPPPSRPAPGRSPSQSSADCAQSACGPLPPEEPPALAVVGRWEGAARGAVTDPEARARRVGWSPWRTHFVGGPALAS